MSNIKVKIKKLGSLAVIPSYSRFGDAGMDMTATSKYYDDHGNVCYGTQISLEIPLGFVGYIFPRSSNAKKDLILSNSVGVIDSGYRGEVIFKFKPVAKIEECSDDSIRVDDWYNDLESYKIGDRVGQLIIMPIPKIEFIEVDELSNTDRGVGSFGSTDPITKSIEDNC